MDARVGKDVVGGRFEEVAGRVRAGADECVAFTDQAGKGFLVRTKVAVEELLEDGRVVGGFVVVVTAVHDVLYLSFYVLERRSLLVIGEMIKSGACR